MKQNKRFYFTLMVAALSGAFTIYCSYDKNLGGAVINLICFGVNIWCLTVLRPSGGGNVDLNNLKKLVTMRFDNQQDMILSNYSNQMKLNDLTGKRLADLERNYSELAASRKEKELVDKFAISAEAYFSSFDAEDMDGTILPKSRKDIEG